MIQSIQAIGHVRLKRHRAKSGKLEIGNSDFLTADYAEIADERIHGKLGKREITVSSFFFSAFFLLFLSSQGIS